jgi:hypothetical protein
MAGDGAAGIYTQDPWCGGVEEGLRVGGGPGIWWINGVNLLHLTL